MRRVLGAVLAVAAAGWGRADGPPMPPPPGVVPALATEPAEPLGPMAPTVPAPPAWLDPAPLPAPTPAVPAPPGSVPGPPTPPSFFGSSSNQPFNEKAMFPTPPAALRPAPVAVPLPDVPHPPRRLTGSFEFGFSGSQGNVDVLNVRIGGQMDHRTEYNRYHTDVLYTLSRFDRENTQNQALLNVRDEWVFDRSQWSVFAAGQVEYDEFRTYNFRAGAYTGFAYQWLKSDRVLIASRAGAGATRELATEGGAPNRWVPEALFGGDFNYRFNDRQAFLSSLDFYPNIGQIGQYRVRARAGYEIVLDPSIGLVLRLGLQDRFDSNPGPAKRNDVNFFTTLMFKF